MSIKSQQMSDSNMQGTENCSPFSLLDKMTTYCNVNKLMIINSRWLVSLPRYDLHTAPTPRTIDVQGLPSIPASESLNNRRHIGTERKKKFYADVIVMTSLFR